MTSATIIKQAAADGVTLSLAPAGTVKAVGDKAAVARWTAAIREHKPGIVALLQASAPDHAKRSRRWALHFADRPDAEMLFHPETTRAEALAAVPLAVAADPIPDTPSRPATEAEAAELRAPIRALLPGDPEGQAEALQIALSDVDAAMTCYRSLAADRAPHTR